MAATGRMTNIAPGHGGIERDPLTLASHALPGASVEMLRQCLHLDVRIARTGPSTVVDVAVMARNVGHRVPTGFIDRHLLLVVDAGPAALSAGPRLSAGAGDLKGQPGWLYAKQLRGSDGRQPSPFWLPHAAMLDTRLSPGQPDRRSFRFEGRVESVRVRLLYRRFWKDVADAKGWPDDTIVIGDRSWRNEKD
jgi:hypothetical protein